MLASRVLQPHLQIVDAPPLTPPNQIQAPFSNLTHIRILIKMAEVDQFDSAL